MLRSDYTLDVDGELEKRRNGHDTRSDEDERKRTKTNREHVKRLDGERR